MSLIIPNLYLGSIDEASDIKWLNNNNIDVIYNVAEEVPTFFSRYIQTYKLPLQDHSDQNITTTLPLSFSIIHNSLGRRKNILVHCYAGVSRSASIVIAYIMARFNLSFDDALSYVKSKRSIVNPNRGFIYQLKSHENEIKKIPLALP